MYIILI